MSSASSGAGGAVMRRGEGVGGTVGEWRVWCVPCESRSQPRCQVSRSVALTSSAARETHSPRGERESVELGVGGRELRCYKSFSERALALPFVLSLCLCYQDFTS